jgi:hypothetical protein
MILKTVIALVLAFLSYQAWKIYRIWVDYRRLKKEGVVFNDEKGFSLIRDLMELAKIMSDYPTELRLIEWYRTVGGGLIPPITGVLTPSLLFMNIAKCDYLEDVYVTNN